MAQHLQPLPKGSVRLLPSLFQNRFDLNRRYILSLKTESLLQNFYLEAGLWAPPNELSSRLGFRTQEHCTVYNMMRLADYLFRWSGDPIYADYWERNLWNGILAQQHPDSGMIAYFLPLYAGAEKVWGTPTEDFWCCHGTLVKAHTNYANHIWFEQESGLILSQYIPSEATWQQDGKNVTLHLTQDHQLQFHHRPESLAYELLVQVDQSVEFALRLRLPWWLSGEPEIALNGEPLVVEGGPSSYVEIQRVWSQDRLHLVFPKALVAVPLPDDPGTCGFMDGPVVLAGLNPGEHISTARGKEAGSYTACPNYRINGITLAGDPAHPESFLTADNEREWIFWREGYRTRGQAQTIRFIPLYEVRDETFTVYFPVV